MNSLVLWLAAAVSLLTFCVHTFAGGAAVARPLLADRSLPPASKWLNYLCWHIATVTILFVGAGFGAAALDDGLLPVAAFGSLLAGACSILSAAVAIRAGVSPFRFPSTTLLGLMAIIGGLALLI